MLSALRALKYPFLLEFPGFIHWPERIAQQEIDAHVHIIDWFPTLAKIIGFQAEPRIEWDGLDLNPLLFEKGSLPDRDLYWIWASNINRWALRHNDWKTVKYGRGEPKQEDWQLFNLANDPEEKKNVAADDPERVKVLHERFLVQRSKDLK